MNNYFHLKEISSRNLLRISLLEILLPNPKKTEELTLKLIKGQPYYKYYRPADVLAEERFYHLVCRQTRDAKGNSIPLLDKEGNPIYYQLQYFLDSDTDTLNEEQIQMLLQDARYLYRSVYSEGESRTNVLCVL